MPVKANPYPHAAKKIPPMPRSQRLSVGLICLLAIGLTGYRTPCAKAVTTGLLLCSNMLLPALFPFFVLSGLTVELGIAQRAGTIFSGCMRRIFHLPGSSASLFLLGALGGYPTGARAVAQLYQKQQCCKDDAQCMLALCNNCGPGFFLGIVGGVLFRSTWIGLTLWLFHLFAALVAARLFRGKASTFATFSNPPPTCTLHQALIKAISGAVQSTLGICGFVLFFSVLLCLLRETGLLTLCAMVLGLLFPDAAFCEAICSGLFEISCGVTALETCHAVPELKGAAAVFLLSFGGCSVFFQTMQQTEGTDLMIFPVVKQKLLQAALAAGCSYLFLSMFFSSTPVFAASVSSSPLVHSGISSVAYLLFCAVSLVNHRKSRYNKQ